MSKFEVIVADPPWSFGDKLKMSKVKRGAEANYDLLTQEDIKNLPVKDIAAESAVLALWVPSSLLQEGLDVMEEWGFSQKQTHIWVKTKKEPLKAICKDLIRELKDSDMKSLTSSFKDVFGQFNLNGVLAFGMGRLFRQTHEVVLIGVRGKVYDKLADKSQRSVHLFPATKHSKKPEILQDMLERMFPNTKRLEMFARRSRTGWTCLGNECPDTLGEDIRDAIDRLRK